jgi:hypothetical protein
MQRYTHHVIAAWFHSKSEGDITCICLRWLSRLREWTVDDSRDVKWLCREPNPVHPDRNQSLYSETNLNICVLCGVLPALAVTVLKHTWRRQHAPDSKKHRTLGAAQRMKGGHSSYRYQQQLRYAMSNGWMSDESVRIRSKCPWHIPACPWHIPACPWRDWGKPQATSG